jgi:Bacterial Ig-like domain (group 3)
MLVTCKPAARDGIMHRLKPWFALVLVLGVALLGRAQHTTVTFIQMVGQATPVPALNSSLSPSTYGQTITLSATLPSDATGTVQFYDGPSALGGSVPLASGAAATNVATLTAGTHSISAQYSGDSNYTSATAALSQVVNQATPGQGGVSPVTIASSSNPSSYGQPIQLTSTVPADATGTIVFMDGSTPLGTATISGAFSEYHGRHPDGWQSFAHSELQRRFRTTRARRRAP